MRRKILIVTLAVGTAVGFGSGFASMGRSSHARREAFERHVAEVCVDAARARPAPMDEDAQGRSRAAGEAAGAPAAPAW